MQDLQSGDDNKPERAASLSGRTLFSDRQKERETMAITVNFYGARGGVGTTTTMVRVAGMLMDAGFNVRLDDAGKDGDTLYAVLGEQSPHDWESYKHPFWGDTATPDFILVDNGRFRGAKAEDDLSTLHVLVMTSSYLSMRAVVGFDKDAFSEVILLTNPDWALDAKDVSIVTELEVHEIEHSPAVARTADAGIILRRPLESPGLSEFVDGLVLSAEMENERKANA